MTQNGICVHTFIVSCVQLCWSAINHVCLRAWDMCAHVQVLQETSKYHFSAVWSYSNCWHSPNLHTIWSWRYQATPYSHHLCCGSNRSLPRMTKLARPYLIVQNRSITLRCAPFHRQSVFIGRRNKSHSTHLIRYYRVDKTHMGAHSYDRASQIFVFETVCTLQAV